MDIKQLQTKIDYIISNKELSNEVIDILQEIKSDLGNIKSREDKIQIYLKWISVFKDASNLIILLKDYIE